MKKVFLTCLLLFIFSCVRQHVPLNICRLPQNHEIIIKSFQYNTQLISDKEEKFLTNFYNYKFLKPFIQMAPTFDKYFVSWGFRKLKKRKYYFINSQVVDKKFIAKIKENANLDTYPNAFVRAITVKNTSIRVLPIDFPLFIKKGSFPFDMMQNSSIFIGTPVVITHISKDRKWAFVENYIAAGWIKISDLAYVDNKFIEKWYSNKFVVPIKDRVPVYNDKNFFQFLSFIGARFPLSKAGENYFIIKIPVKDVNNYAKIKEIKVPKEYFSIAPIKLTYKNLAYISNQLTGEPYFWGGSYFFRDCSMTLRDLFAGFNIYLPRNSYDQAHYEELGRYINLRRFSPKNREKYIIKHAKPYLTLIWFPGHIMLYVGKKDGKALIFHNFWSIKLKHHKKYIVGQSCITTLFPGKEIPNVVKNYDFRKKIRGIRYVIPFD